MRTEPSWRGLGWRLGLGAVAAVVVVLLGRLVGLLFDPFMTVLLGLLVGAGSWFLAADLGPAERPAWKRPEPEQPPSAFLVDTRTRRLATTLARAQPGAGFEMAAVARTLAELVAARRPAGVPGDVRSALSPELTAYLQAADDGHPRPLNRRTLRAYLKEIDQL